MANRSNLIQRPKPLSLRDFYKRKDSVLFWHELGGLGDVLMHRMLFNEVRKTSPSIKINFACLPDYMNAAKDHPCIDKVLNSKNINVDDFGIVYNTCVTVVDRYENAVAPFCKEHRSDLYAKVCNITLSEHDMNFNLDKDLIQICKTNMKSKFKNPEKPIVLFSPVSKMATKSLLTHQIQAVVDATKELNLIGIHNSEISDLKNLNIPVINNINIVDWMCYVAAADYVISVDSAVFHMAGGLKKPLVGIFTFADGKCYGKYFDFILIQKHRDHGNWDCGPCFKFCACPKSQKLQKPCLTEITSEEIKNGILKMLEKW